MIDRKDIIVLFSSSDVAIAQDILRLCFSYGLRKFEFLNRSPNGKLCFEKLTSLNLDISLGAGTLYSQEDALYYIDRGAQFIVSPCYVEEVHKVCQDRNIDYIPGASTLQEIYFLRKKKFFSLVKIFPVKQLGEESYIETIKSVLPEIELMATGGIPWDRSQIENYFSKGCHSVGVGSSLIDKRTTQEGQMDLLEKKLKEFNDV